MRLGITARSQLLGRDLVACRVRDDYRLLLALNWRPGSQSFEYARIDLVC